MKYYSTLLWIAFIVAIISLIVGVIAKAGGFVVLSVGPASFLRFTGICLLFAIALSLAQISSGKRE